MSDDTYPMPAHGWTCFHCGETFMTPGSAKNHFGATPDARPGCLIKAEPGLLLELREAEAEIVKLRAENEQLDYSAGLAGAMTADLGRYFAGARSAHQAFLVLDAMEGRALAAEERVTKLEALINSPETEDFMKAIPLEAAHQVERWGADHDRGKTAFDWYWVLGHLGSKCAHSMIAGDLTKAKHHCITLAALALNWHRHLKDRP